MSLKLVFVLLALAMLFGGVLGYVIRWLVSLGKRGSLELSIKQQLLEAKEEARRIIENADAKVEEMAETRLKEAKEKEETLQRTEERLLRREEYLDERERSINRETEQVKRRVADVRGLREKAEELLLERERMLQKITGIKKEEAREELLALYEKEYEESILIRLQKLEANGHERLEAKARDILTTVIHRLGNSVHAEVMTFSIPLPSDEIKGKIIGKEGRNIRAFERATGVDVIVDDSPGHITLSSFDPLRRTIAKIALERLIVDGRIQPTKIEDVVEKAKREVTDIVKQKGEAAALEVGIHDLDPRLTVLLGRLHFRTSYGQNVLTHSIEMAHIAGMLAEELGRDPKIARAGALLHDIGKAVDHEVEGTHVEIGRRILKKFGVNERIIQAMQSHHEEFPYETPESIIVQVADAISGGRPGARRDSVENYLKRLEDLERVAKEFPGVEKSYAIQAGREIRIFVNPGKISDVEMHRLAKNIALRIEEDLKYPGEIKVNVIREHRVVEFAR